MTQARGTLFKAYAFDLMLPEQYLCLCPFRMMRISGCDYSKLNVIAPSSTLPSAKRGHGAKSADRPWQ